ncbi:cysteine peptidase family C39 domain-containing protein [Streptosporangium canum]|uniref:cysteine peptidase family C39 domain-containing protein n=1 Tax=Streptosporangium canum TaxID=324952 RepID=UPI00344AEA41
MPVIRQSTVADCGAACLAMVLGHHGRRTTVREVGEHLQVSRDGLTAFAIAEAARSYGLRTKALSLTPRQLAAVPGPSVVHWEFNHFLVVERWRPDVVEVVDPASGRRRLTPEEFDTGFTGVVLAFEPGPGVQRRGAGAPAVAPGPDPRGPDAPPRAAAPGAAGLLPAAGARPRRTGVHRARRRRGPPG